MIPWRKQRGVAAVEFGIFLIPMITIAFGITEYGRAMYEYNAIAKSVRDATRYLSQYAPGNESLQQDKAICLVKYGNVNCTQPVLLSGLIDAKTKILVKDSVNDASHKAQPITVGGVTTGVANLVTVQVSGYQFKSLMSFVVKDITFNTISATMLQTT